MKTSCARREDRAPATGAPSHKLPAHAHDARRPDVSIHLTIAEREELREWARRRTASHRTVVRCRIVLLRAEGLSATAAAAQIRVSPATVRLWSRRFASGGIAALMNEAAGRGRPAGHARALESAVLQSTCAAASAGRFSVRRVARSVEVSPATVWRIWKRYGISRSASIEYIEARTRQHISETQERGR